MKCIALITGVENVKGPGKGADPKPYDFWKVNFIDTENIAGSPQSMTLPKDPEELAVLLPKFQSAHLKTAKIDIFQNGVYTNFGGFY